MNGSIVIVIIIVNIDFIIIIMITTPKKNYQFYKKNEINTHLSQLGKNGQFF